MKSKKEWVYIFHPKAGQVLYQEEYRFFPAKKGTIPSQNIILFKRESKSKKRA